MILEAQLILPARGNNGEDLDVLHNSLFVDLCIKYGGVTTLHGIGGWTDPDGNIQQEPIIAYNVAYSPEAAPIEELRQIGCDYGARARQTAIYLRHGNGRIEFLKPNHKPVDAFADGYANAIPA